MIARSPLGIAFWAVVLSLAAIGGCASERAGRCHPDTKLSHSEIRPLPAASESVVVPTSHYALPVFVKEDPPEVVLTPVPDDSLERLEQLALEQNPTLARLFREHQAAAARSHYVGKLPDPRLGANVFGEPIETASGSQRATMTVSQMIPWIGRLKAEEQRASLEALAIRYEYEAERLKVLAGVRTGWYRLYPGLFVSSGKRYTYPAQQIPPENMLF